MLSAFWGRITGADKNQKYPVQQSIKLGRVGENAVIFPYCLYADLPDDTLTHDVGIEGALIPVTSDRPSDLARSEPSFFHPKTNSRIVCRNNGDLEIITDTDTEGDLSVSSVDVRVTTSGVVQIVSSGAVVVSSGSSVTISAPIATVAGDLTVQGDLLVGGNSALAGVTSSGKNIGSTHKHTAGTPPGNTGGPI